MLGNVDVTKSSWDKTTNYGTHTHTHTDFLTFIFPHAKDGRENTHYIGFFTKIA